MNCLKTVAEIVGKNFQKSEKSSKLMNMTIEAIMTIDLIQPKIWKRPLLITFYTLLIKGIFVFRCKESLTIPSLH